MIARPITIADVVSVTGYSRHQLRGLLQDLPGYGGRAKRARVARKYSRHDLVVIAVCCELETAFRLRREAISEIVDDIKKALVGPRDVAVNARLIVTTNPSAVAYVDGPADVSNGIVIPLQAILRRVDVYLNVDQPSGQLLPLAPISVGKETRQNRSTQSQSKAPEGRKELVGRSK